MKIIQFSLYILIIIVSITSCSRLNNNIDKNNIISPTPVIDTVASEEKLTDNSKDKVIISNIGSWSHPVKSVIESNGFTIDKVELYQEKTYPVFYVQSSKYDVKINNYRLLSDIADRNGYWNFKIVELNNSIEVFCDKTKKRVTKTKSEYEFIEYDNYDIDTAEKLALDLVIENQKLIYNKETGDYSQDGKAYTVLVKPHGFDERGRYEVRISPSYYSLSVFSYCYVDLKNKTVSIEP